MSQGPVILAAGGTGGHMFPAEALARELLDRGRDVVLVTDIRGKAFGDALPAVRVERIRAATAAPGIVGKVRMVVELVAGTAQARTLLRSLKPSLVVGFGGYPSVPTVFAAQQAGIPTVLHEQNAVLGRANKLLAGKARLICTSFPEVKGLGAADGRRIVRTGNPVRPAILSLRDCPYPAPCHQGPLNLLVTGGSQGASVFGEVVPRAIAMLPEATRLRLKVVQQARPENINEARDAYVKMGVDATLAPFFKDMPDRLAHCHLMIGRSGAGTVAELSVAGRPAILVPYPHAMDDHQAANAKSIEAAGGAWVMPQNGSFSPEALARKLEALFADPHALTEAAKAAASWGIPDAAQRLADAVLRLVAADGGSGSGEMAA
ncbi:undecaprenyldiphospho-muramoylpentapeptide beta-N-acetylglucosaminyltransferase [Aerophototrophica crusticola]|uniref:UDP-N-acetylglucosamine--N-acetylmuramyl-(pentapeptide) pyrophosphoryl-undecaprenol N-acetylglucosamine transferase n=1 Tax=Aerophototrophica crusticola TaxID=1709002 RepID=A0A858R4E6_9PROT|nr:undecaprenyldiphospho-muramoylpentapeptide beta-N-acetylglucosaminyltransferase [Rhodospirillaceae bacterium B3]